MAEDSSSKLQPDGNKKQQKDRFEQIRIRIIRIPVLVCYGFGALFLFLTLMYEIWQKGKVVEVVRYVIKDHPIISTVVIFCSTYHAWRKMLDELKKMSIVLDDVIFVLKEFDDVIGISRLTTILVRKSVEIGFVFTKLVFSIIMFGLRALISSASFIAAIVTAPFKALKTAWVDLYIIFVITSESVQYFIFWLRKQPLAKIAIIAAILNLFSPSFTVANPNRVDPQKIHYAFVLRERKNRSEQNPKDDQLPRRERSGSWLSWLDFDQ